MVLPRGGVCSGFSVSHFRLYEKLTWPVNPTFTKHTWILVVGTSNTYQHGPLIPLKNRPYRHRNPPARSLSPLHARSFPKVPWKQKQTSRATMCVNALENGLPRMGVVREKRKSEETGRDKEKEREFARSEPRKRWWQYERPSMCNLWRTRR